MSTLQKNIFIFCKKQTPSFPLLNASGVFLKYFGNAFLGNADNN